MNYAEFLCEYRVTCDQLDRVTDLLCKDPALSWSQRGFPQMPMKQQIVIWLHFVGHQSQSNSTQCDTLKISTAMRQLACDQVVKALNNIRKDYIIGPMLKSGRRLQGGLRGSSIYPTVQWCKMVLSCVSEWSQNVMMLQITMGEWLW